MTKTLRGCALNRGNYDMIRVRDILRLSELLDHTNPLVIVGADSETNWKLVKEAEFA